MSIWLTTQERAVINNRLKELKHKTLVSLGFETEKEQENPQISGVAIHVEAKRASQTVKNIGTGCYRYYMKIYVGMEKTKLFYEKKDGLDLTAISTFVSESVKKTLAKRAETEKLDHQHHKNEAFVRKEFKDVGIELDEDSASRYVHYKTDSLRLTLDNLDRQSFSIALKALAEAGVLERHTRREHA